MEHQRLIKNRVHPGVRIISGGQTGVDRAALDTAIELKLEHGGWCPQGRKAEDGIIAPRYRLHETADEKYDTRTRLNVQDADGTLILYRGALEGGTQLTARIAGQLRKPLMLVDLGQPAPVGEIRTWLSANHITTLNVAGPRESKNPGIYQEARRLLHTLFTSGVLAG